ncbi:MAG: 30S ribosomal protein S21 [Planctomycetes bacterium]|nr:30S ribosomal protein S21 [Planctomycetota bacterium]
MVNWYCIKKHIFLEDTLIRIQATHNESPESLFRRFKRACAKEGIISQYKRSCFFEKPSDKRRREKRRMIRKAQKDALYAAKGIEPRRKY